jgi:hypothetical protein
VHRLTLTLAVGLGTALAVALALTVLDFYLTGHALGSITKPLLDWPALGVHLSLADIVMLGAAVLAAGFTWRRTPRGGALRSEDR